MAGRWFLIGLAVLTGCCFIGANVHAGLVDSNMVSGPLRAWDGFGAKFSPKWEGVTTVIDTWQEPENSGTSGWISDTGCSAYFGDLSDATILAANWNPGHWETRPTVRKVSSSSDSKVLNSTWLRYAGQEYRATKNENSGTEMARYATLVSPEEKLLANASAIAYRNTSFGDDEFSADGRVSASAILTDAAEEAVAGSTGRSWFEAKYELDRDTDFTLDLDLAIRGQIDFSFTATDVDSGEVAFYFDTIAAAISIGTQQTFNMDGALEAGTYEFALNCMTDAAVNSLGQWNPGGQAKFDLSLDLEEEYVQVWVPGDDFGITSDPDVVAFLAEYFGLPSSFVAGLDPDAVAFLLASLDSTSTTVTGDDSVAGNCIVSANWSSAVAVPEPSTLATLILGGLGCLILGRRRRK